MDAKQVDYLPDEMAKSADHYGVNRQISEFYLGWRAACDAMHAKCGVWIRAIEARAEAVQAKAGPERARYWAATVDKERPRYWRWNDNGTAEWIYPHRTEPSRYDLAWWDDMPPDLYIPCTTEAEARRVAGFADPQHAADWRAACVVEEMPDTYLDVVSPSRQYWWNGEEWQRYEHTSRREFGTFRYHSSARAALAACPTAPPDWRQP